MACLPSFPSRSSPSLLPSFAPLDLATLCRFFQLSSQLSSPREISRFFFPALRCSIPLGMESGKISDDQISASSSFYDGRWLPRQARLNNEDNAWTPSEDSNKEYIQVGQTFLLRPGRLLLISRGIFFFFVFVFLQSCQTDHLHLSEEI